MRTLGPLAVSLALVAVGTSGAPGVADARRIYRPPPRPVIDVGTELGAAIRAKDTAGVTKLLFDPLYNYGVWFADPGCAKQFGAPGVLVGAERAAFARCLVQLKLQATTRQPGATGNGILTYEPGVEIELGHTDGRVRWIGFEYQTEPDLGRPTLSAQAFEALRETGSPNVDAVVREQLEPVLERNRTTSVSAWVKVCLDAKGAVERVATRQSAAPSAEAAAVAAAFETAARGWKFRPFAPRGGARAACSMVLLTYPMSRAPLVETLPVSMQPPIKLARPEVVGLLQSPRDRELELKRIFDDDDDDDEIGGVVGGVIGGPPPPPPPPPRNVPPSLLEGSRLRGNKNILPDPATKAAIAKRGRGKVVGSYKLCVDARGGVTSVTALKTTGFADYDAKIAREMRQWAYRPYMINGKAAAVCTAVTFIYAP